MTSNIVQILHQTKLMLSTQRTTRILILKFYLFNINNIFLTWGFFNMKCFFVYFLAFAHHIDGKPHHPYWWKTAPPILMEKHTTHIDGKAHHPYWWKTTPLILMENHTTHIDGKPHHPYWWKTAPPILMENHTTHIDGKPHHPYWWKTTPPILMKNHTTHIFFLGLPTTAGPTRPPQGRTIIIILYWYYNIFN